MSSELQAAIEEIQKYAKEYLDEYLDAVRDELQDALARAEAAEKERDEWRQACLAHGEKADRAERQRDAAFTAGAEAMREACAAYIDRQAQAFKERVTDHRKIIGAQLYWEADAIRALPIPTQDGEVMADINDIRDEEAGEDEIVQNINVDYWPVLTDPAPSVQPVRAWAVKHNTKGVIATRTDWTKSHAEQIAGDWDVPASPHRVIRVEIREVNDE